MAITGGTLNISCTTSGGTPHLDELLAPYASAVAEGVLCVFLVGMVVLVIVSWKQ